MSTSSSGLRDHLGYWLRRLSDQVHLRFERALAARGVTVAQWNVLVTVYRGDGRSVGEVARFVDTDAAAVSRLVDRLVDKALLARAPDPGSRRRVLLQLTPEGRRLVPELVDLADRNDELFFGGLPAEERARLVLMLRQLLSAPPASSEKEATQA